MNNVLGEEVEVKVIPLRLNMVSAVFFSYKKSPLYAEILDFIIFHFFDPLKDGCRNVPLKGESMQHPTCCAQNLLDTQENVSYTADN